LTKGQLSIIDLRIGELFPKGAWLTVMEYEGPLSWLTKDFVISEASIIAEKEPESPSPDDSISSQLNAAYFLLVGIAVGAVLTLAFATLTFEVIRRRQSTKS
jgi:hypothetical protein